MNDFYKIFASYYDEIFPLSNELKNFVASYLTNKENFLDLGCATGELELFILNNFKLKEIVGLDLDSKMIEIANQKSKGKINFIKKDMLTIDYEEKFDVVTSFGNTIVHLNSLENIEILFKKVYRALKNKGLFFFQILNYNIKHVFPVIENETFRFERIYCYEKELIKFNIKFTLKNTGKIFQDYIYLYPLKHKEIENITKNFKEIRFYGDFLKNPFNPEKSNLLIATLEK